MPSLGSSHVADSISGQKVLLQLCVMLYDDDEIESLNIVETIMECRQLFSISFLCYGGFAEPFCAIYICIAA